MSLANLRAVLAPALAQNYAVAGLVVLGWEDARAYVRAAEAENLPIILQTGPACRAHTPLPVLGAMLTHLAQTASVPTVTHLDHGASLAECRAAIDLGFTSVMFDGSRLPLAQNIDQTAEIAALAHAAGVSCEGEIGFVGYAQGQASAPTNPADAAQFARDTGVDAMAVSVGNVHLQAAQTAQIDLDTIRAIEALTSVPLVIHGGSGVPGALRQFLAHKTTICKFNIGTQLRKAFGTALRQNLASNPDQFDRIAMLKATEPTLTAHARTIIAEIGPNL